MNEIVLTMNENDEIPFKRKRMRNINRDVKDEVLEKKSRGFQQEELDEEEIESLEKAVLGNKEHLVQRLTGEASRLKKEKDKDEENEVDKKNERQPVWFDTDDEMLVDEAFASCRDKPAVMDGSQDYHEILKARFTAIRGIPSWAMLPSSRERKPRGSDGDSSDDDEPLLQRCGAMIGTKDDTLPKGILDMKRLGNLNSQSRMEGPKVTSVQFHQKSTVAMVAGINGISSIFQVDGRGNNKLASIKFQDFPITCARFNAEGTEIIVGSNLHSHFYTYDMMEGRTIRLPLHQQNNMKKFEVSGDGKFIAVCGKFGDIHLLSGRSKELIGTLHMNGKVTAIAFSPDSSLLYSHGDSGEMFIWDMSRRLCIGKLNDEGNLSGASLAVTEQLLATGCISGVVNLYERSTLLQPRPHLIKSIMNLVTSATALAFDPSAQILAMASNKKNDSVKMVHVGSLNVFSNFPGLSSHLNKVHALAFSPHSGYFSLSNNKSTAFLYRLRHFGNY